MSRHGASSAQVDLGWATDARTAAIYILVQHLAEATSGANRRPCGGVRGAPDNLEEYSFDPT